MFSTSPMTGSASFFVNDSDLRVSFKAVFCGVVMRMEVGVVGREEVGLNRGCRCVIRDMCSSEVPVLRQIIVHIAIEDSWNA